MEIQTIQVGGRAVVARAVSSTGHDICAMRSALRVDLHGDLDTMQSVPDAEIAQVAAAVGLVLTGEWTETSCTCEVL